MKTKTPETDFKTIYEDVKVSFRLAAKNILSYLLGLIVISIVMVALMVAISIPIMLVGLVIVGISPNFPTAMVTLFEGFEQYFTWTGYPTPSQLATMIGLSVLGGLPVIGLAFTIVGPFYGMSKEIVESGGTYAEHAFGWFRRKFFSFAGAGILMFLVIGLPPTLVSVAYSSVFLVRTTGIPSMLMNIFAFVWIYVTYGLLSNMLPGVADGLPITDAFRKSVRLGIDHFDRVFGVLTAFFVLILIVVLPLIAWAIYWMPLMMTMSETVIPAWVLTPGFLLVPIISILGLFALAIFGVPAHIVASTRVYMILTGSKLGSKITSAAPEVSLLGGTDVDLLGKESLYFERP